MKLISYDLANLYLPQPYINNKIGSEVVVDEI